MTLTSYDPTSTMRAARDRYFSVNGFGANGGYDEKWANFELGPIPFPFPNSAARVRAIRYHDLHHILTDYDTNFVGEMEISAWEVAAGCNGYSVAWVLGLAGTATWWIAPSRVFKAWVRGRRSASFYGLPLDALLDSTVADARVRMHVPATESKATLGDVATFALAAIGGAVLATVLFAAFLPLVPFGLLARRFAKAPAKAAPSP